MIYDGINHACVYHNNINEYDHDSGSDQSRIITSDPETCHIFRVISYLHDSWVENWNCDRGGYAGLTAFS